MVGSDGIERSFDRRFVTDIERVGTGHSVRGTNLAGGRRRRRRIEIGDTYMGPGLGKPEGDRTAYAAARAGHDGSLSRPA